MAFFNNTKHAKKRALPEFRRGVAQPDPEPYTEIIRDYQQIEHLEMTDNQALLQEMQSINGEAPAFITGEGSLICIARKDQDKREALATKQLIEAARNVLKQDPVIRQATRSVFESFIRKHQETSLQQQARESSNQVNELLIDAIEKKATDIHLEVVNRQTRVYQRIYGQLSVCQTFDKTQGIKIIAAVWNIYVNQAFSPADVAKDGRFVFNHKDQKWLCRVSYGYSKVTDQRSMAIRLRDMNYIPPVDTLGYQDEQRRIIKEAGTSKGITLIVGAVNSGKSTTQTAIMKTRPALEKNIEISDQVEVELDNFIQLQLPIEGTRELLEENREKLRRITTRHDVDFIAINEIRDVETTNMASSMMLQGATGIASIHGSGWADAVNRLVSPTDLNLSPDILFSESFLSLVIVQSLVGVLCQHCRLSHHPDPFWQKHYQRGFGPEAVNRVRFVNNTGCAHCRRSGIRGLTLVAETIPITEANRKLLKDTTNPQALRDWMRDNGIPNIHQHAYGKITRGIIDPLMARRKIGEFNQSNLYDDWHVADTP